MILGQRVRLRPVEKDDLPRYVKWFADPDVRVNLALHLPVSQAQEEKWYERNLQAGDAQAWAIDAQPADMAVGPWVHIGGCGFHNIEWRHHNAELGIVIGARDYWNRGYGTDAVQTLVAFGFFTLNLHRIFLRVYADNGRAIRAYEKAGFVHEGRLRQDNFSNGAYRDTLLMGALRSEWGQPPAVS
ncbi:MAG: GNAT family N-acetyltransferase [Anaerolineales bacterium]|nr:GNAT family N-acetyltransferase [Anaerolineales bacterium]